MPHTSRGVAPVVKSCADTNVAVRIMPLPHGAIPTFLLYDYIIGIERYEACI